MTVAPDTLGPVTVRAHIGQNGDVRVELVGATDAGREALRAIVSDLRRDLAAVLPHANLSLASASASSSDAGGAERFAQPGADQGAGGHADGRRGSGADVTSGARADAPPARTLPISTLAVAGAGLDTFA
jgi:flagellar hook-length control protein FliK